MTDDPILDVKQNGTSTAGVSLDAVTTLIHGFFATMQGMEQRLTARIDSNAAASKERWHQWECDFREYRDGSDRRLADVETGLTGHLRAEEIADERMDARVAPVRNIFGYVSRHWRTIALLALVALGVGADLMDRLT